MERNPIILSYMAKDPQFGYTGRGSGIPRVLKMCRENGVHIQLENDTMKNQFKVSMSRRNNLNAGG